MGNFMCPFGSATDCLDIGSNTSQGMSMKVFLDEISIGILPISRLSKADRPS